MVYVTVREMKNNVETRYGLLMYGEVFKFDGKYFLKADFNQGVRISDGRITEFSNNAEVEKVDAEFVIHV